MEGEREKTSKSGPDCSLMIRELIREGKDLDSSPYTWKYFCLLSKDCLMFLFCPHNFCSDPTSAKWWNITHPSYSIVGWLGPSPEKWETWV